MRRLIFSLTDKEVEDEAEATSEDTWKALQLTLSDQIAWESTIISEYVLDGPLALIHLSILTRIEGLSSSLLSFTSKSESEDDTLTLALIRS